MANEEPILIHGKPLQIGTFDQYHYCMPDTRYFEIADVLVIELSFACIVVKNSGMRGDDKKYRIVDGKKVPLSELDFIETDVAHCRLDKPLDNKFQNAYILFDGRDRERMLFAHSTFEEGNNGSGGMGDDFGGFGNF
ncbi:MAG: hypothetical protein PUA82_03490 [Eubacteriales bacterium]|nr:hypothetical protein [Eubacteriales bacterium]